MARQERKLSARGVAAISKPGRHSDGAGLYLLLKGDNRAWVYLFAWQGRQCEMGLGAGTRAPRPLAQGAEGRT